MAGLGLTAGYQVIKKAWAERQMSATTSA